MKQIKHREIASYKPLVFMDSASHCLWRERENNVRSTGSSHSKLWDVGMSVVTFGWDRRMADPLIPSLRNYQPLLICGLWLP